MDFSHFLYSSDSIPKGYGFEPFSPLHIFWLVLWVVSAVFCCLLYRRLDTKKRKIMQWVLTALIVGDEIWKMAWLMSLGLYTHSYLPFHLCSINIFLILFHTIKPTETVANFFYIACIPTAAAAMLFPTWTKLPFWNFMHLHSFSVHILLFIYPLMLLAGGDIRPRLRYLPRSLLLLLGLAGIAKGVNLLFDTNFMFLESVSKGNPLKLFEDLFGNHLIGFPVLAVIIILIMYLPLILIRRHQRKEKTA